MQMWQVFSLSEVVTAFKLKLGESARTHAAGVTMDNTNLLSNPVTTDSTYLIVAMW